MNVCVAGGSGAIGPDRAPLRVPSWLLRLLAPSLAHVTSMRLPVSKARAKAALGWQPKCPAIEDGLAQMFRPAA